MMNFEVNQTTALPNVIVVEEISDVLKDFSQHLFDTLMLSGNGKFKQNINSRLNIY